MKVFDQDPPPDRENSKSSYLKVILGLILLVAMISQSHLDPSPLNLLRPAGGIGNWLGMPGALLAGFLTDLFGWCGFLLPLSLLVLNHSETLNRRQITLLDGAMLLLLTIGLAQFSAGPDTGPETGLVGAMANIYLQAFPGRLITILMIAGFVLRYAKHYRPNLQFFVMVQQLGAVLVLAVAFLDSFAQKRVSKLSRKLRHRVSPFSIASKEKLTAAKEKTASKWRSVSGKVADRLLEMNPFYRFPVDNADSIGTSLLNEEEKRELQQRMLLNRTIEELERRTAMEG